ncbi:MAG: tetratricopeptide repeat protein [bacterium]
MILKSIIKKIARILYSLIYFIANLSKKAETHYRLACASYDSRNFELAIKQINICLKYDDEDQYAHNLLGRIYIDTNRFDDAVEAFFKAIKCNDKDYYPNMMIAYIRYETENYVEAVKYYLKALKLYDDSDTETTTTILWYLSGSYNYLSDYNNASLYLKKLLNIDPKHEKALFAIGHTYFQIFRKEQDKTYLNNAIRYLEKAIEINSTNDEALCCLAVSSLELGASNSAKTYIEKAIEINQDNDKYKKILKDIENRR